jgi:hypothetical protein
MITDITRHATINGSRSDALQLAINKTRVVARSVSVSIQSQKTTLSGNIKSKVKKAFDFGGPKYRILASAASEPLNMIARQEQIRPDHVFAVALVDGDLRLHFADDYHAVVSLEAIGFDQKEISLDRVSVAPGGNGISMVVRGGKAIAVDGSTLRSAVDREFAAVLSKSFWDIVGPFEELVPSTGQ